MLENSDRESIAKDKFVFVGLIAASFTMVLTLVSQANYSMPLIISLCGFASGLPFLALMAFDVTFQEASGKMLHSPVFAFATMIAISGTYLGFISAFWHVHKVAGIVALVSILGANACFMRANHLVSKLRNGN